jgi:hypothetical protein
MSHQFLICIIRVPQHFTMKKNRFGGGSLILSKHLSIQT